MDLTVLAIPGYVASMGLEFRALERRRAEQGPSAADYEWRDTITSLTMGFASLAAPIVVPKLVRPLVPGKGHYGKVLVGTALGALAVSVAADAIARRAGGCREAGDPPDSSPRAREDRAPESDASPTRGPRRLLRRALQHRHTGPAARRVAGAAAVTAVTTGGLAITTSWATLTAPHRFWARRFVRDLGTGPGAIVLAVLGWDFIYYWNHRFQHESRYMWAHHVVHHSSERYNLSTALRQPVAEVLCTFLPYGLLSFFGIRPALVETARGVNLIYQYWIHTDTIRKLGWFEQWFNTPSHHRVHHGSNREYIDRNHGSIFIVWDRLFGTFQEERAPVVYGLTSNIKTFNPFRVIGREYSDMLRDVANATTWRDRVAHVVRGPGWSYARRSAPVRSAVLVEEHPSAV